MAEVVARIENKTFKWDDVFSVQIKNQVGGSGKLKEVPPETKVSLKQLIELMIIESDNTATEMLTEITGMPAVTKRAKSLGMPKTVMSRRIWDFEAINKGKDNLTTSSDLLHFFDNLHGCAVSNKSLTGFSQYSCQVMLDILKQQKNRKMIPRYLSNKTSVAHKTGELTGVVGDAGIVYIDPPVIFSILANNTDNDKAREGIAKFVKTAIDILQKGAAP